MNEAEKIAARRDAWLEAFTEADIARLTELVTSDHLAMPPNQSQRVGTQAAQDFWREGFSAGKTDFKIRPQHLTVAGDLAVDRFGWDMVIEPHGGGQPIQDRGKCLWIWRREADGAWRIGTAIWNSDLDHPGVWSTGGAWAQT